MNDEGAAAVRCFACGGPYHPASGHLFAPDIVYCGACYRPFLAWLKKHTGRRWGGADFYAEAATSIREGIFPPPQESEKSTSPQETNERIRTTTREEG